MIPLKPPSVTSTLPCLTTSNPSLRPQSLTSLPWRRNILSYPLVSSFCLVQKYLFFLIKAHVLLWHFWVIHTNIIFVFYWKCRSRQNHGMISAVKQWFFSIHTENLYGCYIWICPLELFPCIFCKTWEGAVNDICIIIIIRKDHPKGSHCRSLTNYHINLNGKKAKFGFKWINWTY